MRYPGNFDFSSGTDGYTTLHVAFISVVHIWIRYTRVQWLYRLPARIHSLISHLGPLDNFDKAATHYFMDTITAET